LGPRGAMTRRPLHGRLNSRHLDAIKVPGRSLYVFYTDLRGKADVAEVAVGRGCRPLPASQALFYTKLRRNAFKPQQSSLLLGEARGGPAQRTLGGLPQVRPASKLH